MKWATRERRKVERVACPWLIRRFVDAEAEFLYVAADQVQAVAEQVRRMRTAVKTVILRPFSASAVSTAAA
jgi:hypothetical protein